MYVTLEEYIERYGAEDLVRATKDRVTTVTAAALKAYADGEDTSPTTDVLTLAGIWDVARQDAEAFVNSFIGADYQLPIETDVEGEHEPNKVPRVLRNITADVIRYEVHAKTTPEPVAQRYKDAVKWLEGISKGTLNLTLTGEEADTPRLGGARVHVIRDTSDPTLTNALRRFSSGY